VESREKSVLRPGHGGFNRGGPEQGIDLELEGRKIEVFPTPGGNFQNGFRTNGFTSGLMSEIDTQRLVSLLEEIRDNQLLQLERQA
jgi:hypothetical protein